VLAGIPKRIREHFSRRHREVVAVGSKRRLPGNTEFDAALARDGAGTSRRGARKKALDWQPGWVLRPIGANFRGSHGIAPCRTGSFGIGAVAPGGDGRGWRLRRAKLRRSIRHVRR
jgi:hypothetical protein